MKSKPDSPKDVPLHELLQRAYRFAFSLTHEQSAAEDLVQDAWLALLKTDGPRTIPYLLTVIRNRFIDQWRRNRVVEIVPLETPDIDESVTAKDPWNDDSELRVSSRTLDEALHRLNADERASLYLSAVEGYSTREIAELFGKPRGTILSMIFRSREKLRKILAPESEVKP